MIGLRLTTTTRVSDTFSNVRMKKAATLSSKSNPGPPVDFLVLVAPRFVVLGVLLLANRRCAAHREAKDVARGSAASRSDDLPPKMELLSQVDECHYADYLRTSMQSYKRNQVEGAVFRALGAKDERANEVKLRLKRLLVADREFKTGGHSVEGEDHYAFYDQTKPPGSGIEVMFSPYEAFALLAAIILLEHGLPQQTVVKVMRQVRADLEPEHTRILKKDPKVLFDQKVIDAQALPGTIPLENTDPVFLVVVRLTGSSLESSQTPAAAVCRGQTKLMAFIKKRSLAGIGATFFEFTRLMHTFAKDLSRVKPAKRGRAPLNG